MRKITLITTFPPSIGGGGTCLRGALPHFKNVDVTWCYIAPASDPNGASGRWLGPSMISGSPMKQLVRFFQVWSDRAPELFGPMLDEIAKIETEKFWVVAHNEGLRIARELQRRTGKPVHLSIQDDPADGVYGRSRRFRFFRGLVWRYTRQNLHRMDSIDVISKGMQAFYWDRLGVASTVFHPVVEQTVLAQRAFEMSAIEIQVGHVGSLYSTREFLLFLDALVYIAKERNKRLVVNMIGAHRGLERDLGRYEQFLCFEATLPEEEAVQRLAQCHFVYAMYPFGQRFEVFRRTSQPTKLSTYIQALRPMFFHSPEPSSLADFLKRYHVGVNCASCSPTVIRGKIQEALDFVPDPRAFQEACEQEFGRANAAVLEDMLLS